MGGDTKEDIRAMTSQIPTNSLIPSKIYLQIDTEFDDLEGVTWCVDKINDTDIEYAIAESVPIKKSELNKRLGGETMTPNTEALEQAVDLFVLEMQFDDGAPSFSDCLHRAIETRLELEKEIENRQTEKSELNNRCEKGREDWDRIVEALCKLNEAFYSDDGHDDELRALMKVYDKWLD